ncbi:MAG: restriction endonuclease, partial [Gemmatimonadales bacterium]|nr:restriction endonuclease [Gemmatimonadales bacterium]
MDAQTFLNNFGTIAQAPDGIDQLRQLVLNLAVQGWLVEQEPGEEGADPLLSRMQALRDVLVDAGVINRPRHPSGVPVSDPPCELPDGWAWSRLGDISAIVGGGTPKSTDPSFWS